MNHYAYALNRPLVVTDPDGRCPLCIIAGAGAAVYGGWQVYQNVSQGRPWYDNVGVEATKGALIGATMGLAGPAIASMTTADVATATSTATMAGRGLSDEASGKHILLGLERFGLSETATQIGAQTLLKDPNWKASFLESLADSSCTLQRQSSRHAWSDSLRKSDARRSTGDVTEPKLHELGIVSVVSGRTLEWRSVS